MMIICVPHMACVRMFFWGYDFIVCCCLRVRCGQGERCRPPRVCAYCHAHTFYMNCTVSAVWLVPVHVRRNRVVGSLWAMTSRGSVYYRRLAVVVSAELLHNVRSGYLLVFADTSRWKSLGPGFLYVFLFSVFYEWIRPLLNLYRNLTSYEIVMSNYSSRKLFSTCLMIGESNEKWTTFLS